MREFLRKRKPLVLEMTRRNIKPNANVTIARKQLNETVFYMDNCRALKRLSKKTKDSWGKEKPKRNEELHTMLAESFATVLKNMTKKGIFQIQSGIWSKHARWSQHVWQRKFQCKNGILEKSVTRMTPQPHLEKQAKPKPIAAVGVESVIKRAVSLKITLNTYLVQHYLTCPIKLNQNLKSTLAIKQSSQAA